MRATKPEPPGLLRATPRDIANDEKPRALVRKKHRKARTGCITCKIRKVKCDEAKPACVRCERFGTECSGYKARSPSTSEQTRLETYGKVLLPSNRLRVHPSIALLHFDTEHEHRYFALFSDSIINEVLPYFDPTPWRLTILQACASQPSIRHAAIAIGALGKTFETVQAGHGRPIGKKRNQAPVFGGPVETAQRIRSRVSPKDQLQEATSHHQYALEQYHKAIKEMRALASGHNIRTILITCLITACFESLHGNQASALLQLETGFVLIQNWKNSERDVTKHPLGFSSPAPDTIEDYLIQFFGRLEVQSMSFRDSRPADYHLRLKEEGKDIIQNMPRLLTSVSEAHVYLFLITKRMMHFTSHFTSATDYFEEFSARCSQIPLLPPVSAAERWGGHDISGTFKWDGLGIGPQEFVRLPSESQSIWLSTRGHHPEQNSLTTELANWDAAFAPLLNRSIAHGGPQCVSALALSLLSIAGGIAVRTAFVELETDYDAFTPEFEKIVSQASLLLSTLEACTPKHKPRLAFSLDFGVIPPLYLVIMKCRISEIRRNALQLLKANPRREGVYDSVSVAALGTWIAELEERGVGAGEIIPEENRTRKASIAFDLTERKATLSCWMLDMDVGEFVQKKKYIIW